MGAEEASSVERIRPVLTTKRTAHKSCLTRVLRSLQNRIDRARNGSRKTQRLECELYLDQADQIRSGLPRETRTPECWRPRFLVLQSSRAFVWSRAHFRVATGPIISPRYLASLVVVDPRALWQR